MPRPGVVLFCVVVAALASIVAPPGAAAQDAAVVNAKFLHVRVDNEHVRVFETVLEPGDKEALHSHPASVIYVIEGGTTRSHTPDGRTSETTLAAGDVLYRDPITHWAENTGTTTIRIIVVELRDPK